MTTGDKVADNWDQHITQVYKEAQSAQKKARAKIRETFKALGWREINADEGSAINDRVWLEAVNEEPAWSGLILHASAGGYRAAGRVRWSIKYPKPKVGQEPYSRDWPRPDASMSLDKSADVMAREVARRIFPEALKGLDMARKANADSDRYANAQQSNLAALLGRELTESERKDGRSRFDGLELAMSYGDCRASSEDVSLELHGVPIDVALKIMEALRTGKKPQA